MNMEAVIMVNGVVCRMEGSKVYMFNRFIKPYPKSKKIVEKHVLTGKFVSRKY